MQPEEHFHHILSQIPNATLGKMFGALAAKLPNGKAGAMYKDQFLLVKRTPEQLGDAAQLAGVEVFTPKPGRPMNGWYQIPFEHKQHWQSLMQASCADVAALPPKK
ncbi:MAG: hypothetical protein Q4F57_08525 [Weeksellaceae bacterium]|nr:hypothetical protein [Weeksellaceae bacterium]